MARIWTKISFFSLSQAQSSSLFRPILNRWECPIQAVQLKNKSINHSKFQTEKSTDIANYNLKVENRNFEFNIAKWIENRTINLKSQIEKEIKDWNRKKRHEIVISVKILNSPIDLEFTKIRRLNKSKWI